MKSDFSKTKPSDEARLTISPVRIFRKDFSLRRRIWIHQVRLLILRKHAHNDGFVSYLVIQKGADSNFYLHAD